MKLAILVCLSCVALAAGAAAVRENAPANNIANKAQTSPSKPAPSVALDEYLQLHRDSGYAIYASPLESIAPDGNVATDSCAKAHAVPIN